MHIINTENKYFAAKELTSCANELSTLADHPETKVTGGEERVKALRYAAELLRVRASELRPFQPKKFS
jgi:hypothetical protein